MIGNTTGVDRWHIGLVLLTTTFALGHHADHVIRGNHVGWPVTPEVNLFTYTLAIYPLVGIGLYLTATERVGPRFWFSVAAFGLVLLGIVHLGPGAVEPPHDIVTPYDPTVLGFLAFAWLLGLLGILAVTTLHAASLWRRVSQSRNERDEDSPKRTI